MTDNSQITEVINLIVRYSNPDKIYLFGSCAKGTETENSDIDIIVVKNDMDLPHHRRAYEIKKHLKGILIPVDILVYSQNEINELKKDKYSFIFHALKTGVILYEKTGKNFNMV